MALGLSLLLGSVLWLIAGFWALRNEGHGGYGAFIVLVLTPAAVAFLFGLAALASALL